MKTAGLIFRNVLKSFDELSFIVNFHSSRFGLFTFRSRDNGFVIRSRCALVLLFFLVLLLFLGLSLKLDIVASLDNLCVVTIQLFGIPVVGVVYISRLT